MPAVGAKELAVTRSRSGTTWGSAAGQCGQDEPTQAQGCKHDQAQIDADAALSTITTVRTVVTARSQLAYTST